MQQDNPSQPNSGDEESPDKRPPLPPTSALPPPRGTPNGEIVVKPTFSRDESTGEVSNVTEPSLEINHRRTVSWDANVKKTGSDELKDLLQPVLNKNEQSPPKQVVKKAITVADLHAANPLESEAETSLMKAIEQRAVEEKHRGSTTGNRLFAHIPDEGLEALQADSSPDAGSLGGSNNEGGKSLSPKTHRRKKSKPFAVPRDKNASLESTLFSLTAAMKEMHTTHDDEKIHVPNHHRLPHEAHEEAFEAPSDDEPTSNADSMVRHAAFLFQNPLRKNKLQGKSDDLEEKTPLKTSSHSHHSRLSVASGMDESRQSGGNHLDGVPEEVEYSSEDSDPELGDSATQNSSNEHEDISSNEKKRKGIFAAG